MNSGVINLQDIVEYNSHTNSVYFIIFLPYTVDAENSIINKRDPNKRVICLTH